MFTFLKKKSKYATRVTIMYFGYVGWNSNTENFTKKVMAEIAENEAMSSDEEPILSDEDRQLQEYQAVNTVVNDCSPSSNAIKGVAQMTHKTPYTKELHFLLGLNQNVDPKMFGQSLEEIKKLGMELPLQPNGDLDKEYILNENLRSERSKSVDSVRENNIRMMEEHNDLMERGKK